jgi:hypothetical protein
VVALLPEVVPESAQGGVVTRLLGLMADEPAMTTAVLEVRLVFEKKLLSPCLSV